MKKAKLTLLACPSLLAFLLISPHAALAKETVAQPTASEQPVEIVFERPAPDASQLETATDSYDCDCSSESPMLNVSDEESDAAIKRYGCDCAGCVNAVRQLQGKLPLL